MRRRRRRRGSNRAGIFSILFIVAILLASLSFQSHGLKQKMKVYAAQKENLEQQITSETQRSDEIAKMEEYKKTKEYVEEMAKDKLGLVYEDEIIFKPSKP